MDYFANIFRSLLDEIREKKRERCGINREEPRAVGSSSLTISFPAANGPQEETRLCEMDAIAEKGLIEKTDQEDIDGILDAFRRNDVAWMNRNLENLKLVLTKIASIEQEVEQMKCVLRLHGPKQSDLTNTISRHYTQNTPSFRNASTSTPLSQNVNSLLYKEVGLRPMNPACRKIAYDFSDDEPNSSQDNLNAHQNSLKSSTKKRTAHRGRAKGGKSSRHGRRH